MTNATNLPKDNPVNIAIIGMACRFPGAKDYNEFWQNLANDINNITEIPAERSIWRNYLEESQNDGSKTHCKWGGFIKGIDQFDAGFFNISPLEAKVMDPQQRLLLESVWNCIEDAGYAPLSLTNKNIGVYIGACNYDYKNLLDRHAKQLSDQFMFGVVHSTLANRLSYYFDLHGPSMLIDTACSSSLVAIHQAVQAILNSECDAALVGGVNLLCDPERSLTLNNAGILSPTGQCHSFDENADGYVRGEGVGVIFLKPLEEAMKDNNIIYGVIKGTAINHGGHARSISSPNPYLQAQVVTKAWKQANINPNQIGYIEAHGTGTPLGDPIELIGLQKAFKQLSNYHDVHLAQHYCGIGTVKTNIGHLEAASGIAGLIKVILAFKYNQLPRLQNFKNVNPHLALKNSPFYLMTETKSWCNRFQDHPKESCLRVAGVSSFGIGGTNAHVVIEESPIAPSIMAEEESEEYCLLTLSAKNPESLQQRIVDLKDWVANNPSTPIASLAYSLNVTRDHFNYRCGFVINSIKQLQNELNLFQPSTQFDNGQHHDAQFKEEIHSCYEKLKSVKDCIKHKLILKTLASMYVKGCSIEWAKLHPVQNRPVVQIPVYPFLKNRYWFTSDNGLNHQQTKKLALKNKHHENKLTLQIIDQEIGVLHMHDKTYKNQMNVEFLNELQENLDIIKNNSTIKVLIITGYDDIFCLGSDENGLRAIANADLKFTSIPSAYQGLISCKIPVISAVQGHAFGAGLTFGLSADIVILSEQHTYTANFMNYGITPGVGSTLILREKLSTSLATEMMWTGREYRGHELAGRGVPVIVKPAGEVFSVAMDIAKSLANKPLSALQVFKKSMSNYMLQKLPSIIEEELTMHQEIFQSTDAREKIDDHFSKLRDWKSIKMRSESKNKEKISLKNLQDKPVSKTEEKNNPGSTEKCFLLLQDLLASQLHIPIDEIQLDSEFIDLGADSIVILMLVEKINKTLQFQLSSSTLYNYRSVGELAAFLTKELDKKTSNSTSAHISPLHNSTRTEEHKFNVEDITGVIESTRIISEVDSRLFPTTTKQERWFKLSIEGIPIHEFNILERITWHEQLNLTTLRRSLTFLIKEQAVLRTQFVFKNETLYQRILSSSDDFKIKIEDAHTVSPEHREAHTKERCEYYNRLVIPFTDYPLWQIVIIQFAKDNYEILLLSSHLIVDVYALALMAKQLFASYVAIEKGQEPKAPALKISFADYVIEQQKKYQSNLYADDLHYWQNKLSQPQKRMYLDNKVIADPVVKFRPSMKGFVISKEQARDIQSFANQQSCTDTSFFLTLLRVVLFHYTDTKDIWIDIPDASRDAQNSALIGWTSTSYPHITLLSEHDSFAELMIKVQNEFRLVKQHSKLPLSNLTYPDDKRFRDEVTAIQFNRIKDMDIFYENFNAIKKVEFPVTPHFFCYNFACIVREKNSEYCYDFLYNTEQFDGKFIQQILTKCQLLMNGVLSKKTITISNLLLLIVEIVA